MGAPFTSTVRSARGAGRPSTRPAQAVKDAPQHLAAHGHLEASGRQKRTRTSLGRSPALSPHTSTTATRLAHLQHTAQAHRAIGAG